MIKDNSALNIVLSRLQNVKHAKEIIQAQLTDASDRCNWYTCADCAIYENRQGEIYLHLVTGKDNLIFNNLVTALEQLALSHNYFPKQYEAEKAISQSQTLTIKYRDLDLKIWDEDNPTLCYFEVCTSSHAKLNKSQQQLVEYAYGSGEELHRILIKFKKMGIHPRVYLLTPDYIRKTIKKNGFIVRSVRLFDWACGAHYWCVTGSGLDGNGPGWYIKGERKASVHPSTSGRFTNMLREITANPKHAASCITPTYYLGLKRTLTLYEKNRGL